MPTTVSVTAATAKYHAYVAARQVENPTPDSELASVAANLCDNSRSDFDTLMRTLQVIETKQLNSLDLVIEKLSVVDAFCPARRSDLTAAAKAVIGADFSDVKP